MYNYSFVCFDDFCKEVVRIYCYFIDFFIEYNHLSEDQKNWTSEYLEYLSEGYYITKNSSYKRQRIS